MGNMACSVCYGLLLAVGCLSFAVCTQSENIATSDEIQIKSIEWRNNTVGTMFLIKYEADVKPQVLWEERATDLGVFAFARPLPGSQENIINSYSHPKGLIIVHVPHTPKSRYTDISLHTESLSVQIHINEIAFDKQGPTGKAVIPSPAVTINPFGSTNKAMKDTVIHIESKVSTYSFTAHICTVNTGQNIKCKLVRSESLSSEKDGEVFKNQFKIDTVPLNSILAMQYKVYGIWPTRSQTAMTYFHRMFVKDPDVETNAVSIISNAMNPKPEIPLKTTAFLRCVALGFPRPSVYFMKGDTQLKTDHSYDVGLGYVTVANVEIPDFSLANRGQYRCIAESGSSRSYFDLAVSHSPHIFRDETTILTLTKDKVELVCVADGDENFVLSFQAEFDLYGKNDERFELDSNTTITFANKTTSVSVTTTSLSATRKSAKLILSKPNMQFLSGIQCVAEDTDGYTRYHVLDLRDFKIISTSFINHFPPMKTASCRIDISGFAGEDIPDIITIEWYKNEVKPENRILPDANTVIVNQNDNIYDDPTSYLILMDKVAYEKMGFKIICRAYTRFRDYQAVVKDPRAN